MGLDIIEGTMGGGKSIYAVEMAVECWKAGGWVHSNLPFIDEELAKNGWLERHIKLPKDTTQWARKEVQADGSEMLVSDIIVGGAESAENLVIIDEAALQFHAYDQVENRKKNRALFDLVVMSRQIGVHIYFISQSAANIDAAIRKVAQNVIRCVNVRNIAGIGALIAPFVGNFRRLWLTPDKGRVQSACFAWFKPSIACLYKTHGEGDKIGIKRDASRKVQRAKLSPVVWLFLLMIFGLFGTAAYMAYRTPSALRGTELHFAKRAEESKGTTGSGPGFPAPSVYVPPAPYVVARRINPPAFYDSRGRVYSMAPKSGERIFDSVVESDTAFILQMRGVEVANLKKPD